MVDSPLGLLIRKRLDELGLSLREATDPRRVKGLITKSALSQLARGETRSPQADTIKGVALAIAVPVREVEEALALPPELGRFTLPRRADRLTEKERAVVIGVVDALLAARRDR